MDRTAAIEWVQTAGFDALASECGRTLQDGAMGLGPALDDAFDLYASARVVTVEPVIVAVADRISFKRLLKLTVYDLLLPTLAAKVDTSVDAPLTNAKLSQMYRQGRAERDSLWEQTVAYGYGYANVSGFVAAYDFLEPGTLIYNAEYASP